MRIDQLGRPVAQAPRARRSQEKFSVGDEAAALEPAAPGALAAPTDVLGVCGAAQTPAASPAERDREAAQHGDAMLKTLTRLQLGALGGDADGARACLAALAGSLKQAADPGLNAVLQGIAARAAVEVARSG